MMFRFGGKLILRGLQQKSAGNPLCGNATAVKMARGNVQEVLIPVPWGHVTGKWWGDRSVQPVLGLHGWEDNANTFDNLVPLLNVSSFLSIDIMGHGLSSYFPAAGPHNFLDVVILLRRISRHFNWTKISIVGHSFGSAVGYVYSALFPDAVDAYVSIDCARTAMMAHKEDMLDKIRYTFNRTLQLEERLASDPPRYTYEELVGLVYKGLGKSPSRDSCRILLQRGIKESSGGDRRFYLSRDPRLKSRWVGAPTEDFLLACAPLITCRMLSIRATGGVVRDDRCKELFVRMLDLVQRCERHDVEGTHHLHLNNPEDIAPLINKFLGAPVRSCNL